MTDETIQSSNAIWRLMDANINRTQEALRVVEDGLRFVLNDAFCTSVCKRLRHEFVCWAKQFDRGQLLAMRDAGQDVGRSTSVASEYQRQSLIDVLQANFSRAEQSLRTLEEFSKLNLQSELNESRATDSAIQVERMRYQVYDLEKAVLQLIDSRERLSSARLYVLVDACGGSIDAFRDRVHRLSEAGVHLIQLRDKSLDDRQLIEFGQNLVATCSRYGVISIINDRVDVAVSVRADGVHLGQDDLRINQARQLAGPKMLIGVSTHNLEQARTAVMSGASYIGIGPTFPSGTKHFNQFTGPELLREVASDINLPTFAIGGIDLNNIDQVLATGVHGFAISGAIPDQPRDAANAVGSFLMAMDSADAGLGKMSSPLEDGPNAIDRA